MTRPQLLFPNWACGASSNWNRDQPQDGGEKDPGMSRLQGITIPQLHDRSRTKYVMRKMPHFTPVYIQGQNLYGSAGG